MLSIEDRIKYTPRGFSYVEVLPQEVFAWGGLSICDGCNKPILERPLYLSFVLADTFCEKCWNEILERQENYSQEDVDSDLKLQNEYHVNWYKYHLDPKYRDDVIHGIEEY